MKKIEDVQLPDELRYSADHEWVRMEDGSARIGITDYAQEKMGEILSLDLPEADSYVEWNEPFGSIETAKGVVELISPVSGVVISVNEDITDDIGIINSDPHDTGWMIIVEMEDLEELDDLLDVSGYQEFVIQEAEVD